MSVQDTITTILISASVSGLLATYVSFYLYRQHTKDLLKCDILRRLAGYRHLLTKRGKADTRGEPPISELMGVKVPVGADVTEHSR